MRVTAEDTENAEDAEEQGLGRHTRNLLRLTQRVEATVGTAANRSSFSSVFSVSSVCSAIISIAVFRIRLGLRQIRREGGLAIPRGFPHDSPAMQLTLLKSKLHRALSRFEEMFA